MTLLTSHLFNPLLSPTISTWQQQNQTNSRAKMTAKSQYELVFIPSPGRSHLQPALDLANLLINRDEQLSISVLLLTPSFSSVKNPTADSLQHSSGISSRVRLFDVPPGEFTPSAGSHSTTNHCHFVQSQKDNVRDEVAKIVHDLGSNSALKGFIVDMFCTSMKDVANEFGVPTYVFFTCGASFLGFMFHIQSMIYDPNQDVMAYENSENEISIPSYRYPVPSKQLPAFTFYKTCGSKVFFDLVEEYKEIKGFLVNTFQELETHGMKALSENEQIPTIYAIGPRIHTDNGNEDNPRYDEIMNWLAEQPDSSVVFLCFGNYGSFDENQVKEIALSLEHSGHRFLWSLRKPAPPGKFATPSDYEKPEEVLPEGFLQRTAGIGKVIGWAPQFAVLSHSAVGGFVSHCGWNSTLESIWCGVPIGVWPLFAEQQLNAFQLVKDLELGVDIKMDYNKGSSPIVTADEIENGIRVLMEPGSKIKTNVEAMKWKSRAAVSENGSSFDFVGRFLKDCVGKN